MGPPLEDLRLHRSSSVALLPTRWGENHPEAAGSAKSMGSSASVPLKRLLIGAPIMSPPSSSRKNSVPPIRPQRHILPMAKHKPEVLLQDVVWESLE